jgi:hypothetical protein
LLAEVGDEPDRLVLAVQLELELYLEWEIGRDALPLPNADVLLDDALHAAQVQAGRLGNVVDADGHRDAHALPDLGRSSGLLGSHVMGRRHVAADGHPTLDVEARAPPPRLGEEMAASGRGDGREEAGAGLEGTWRGGAGGGSHGSGGGRHDRHRGREGWWASGELRRAGGAHVRARDAGAAVGWQQGRGPGSGPAGAGRGFLGLDPVRAVCVGAGADVIFQPRVYGFWFWILYPPDLFVLILSLFVSGFFSF